MLDIEVQVRSLKANLQDFRDTMGDLEMHMESHEAMLVEKEKYTTNLEGQLTRATFKVLYLEGWIHGLQVQLDATEGQAVAVEKEAAAAMAVMEAVKKEVVDSM